MNNHKQIIFRGCGDTEELSARRSCWKSDMIVLSDQSAGNLNYQASML